MYMYMYMYIVEITIFFVCKCMCVQVCGICKCMCLFLWMSVYIYMGQLHQLVPVMKKICFSIFTDLDSTWPRFLMVISQHVVPIYRNTRYFLLNRERNAFYITLSIKICQKKPCFFKTAEVDLAILDWWNYWKIMCLAVFCS